MADEGGALLDDDTHRLEVAEEFGVGLQFAAFLDCHIAVHGAVDDDCFRANISFDHGIFAESENAFGDDFAVEFAIENHFAVEFQSSCQLNITSEDVFGCGGFRDERSDVVEVHVALQATHFSALRSMP